MGCPRLLGYCYSLAPMPKYFTRSQPPPPRALLRQSQETAVPYRREPKKCSLETTYTHKLGEGRDDNCSVCVVWAEYQIHLLETSCFRETSFCSFLHFFWARGGAVGSSTALQAGRSRVRFSMLSLT
jgi:hypothetical protein